MAFHLSSLHPFCQGILFAKYGWNWPSGPKEFSLFRNYLPLEKCMALHLNKLQSPLPKDALCQVWLKLAQWFWRKRFFNSSMYFRNILIISPCKRAGPFIWTNLNPLHPRMLGVWLELVQWFWRRWWKYEKFTTTTKITTKTDTFWSKKLTLAQVS